MLLIETISGDLQMIDIKNNLNYFDCFSVLKRGHSGGLAFLIKKEGSAKLLGSSDHFINVEVHIVREEPYRVTGFYGLVDRA